MNEETQFKLEMLDYINKRCDLCMNYFDRIMELNKPRTLSTVCLFLSLLSLLISFSNAVKIDKLKTRITIFEHHK